jgi:hypothetical protein
LTFNPGDLAAPFALPLIDGRVFDYKPTSKPGQPIFVHVYNDENIWQEYGWLDYNRSMDEFLESNISARHLVLPLRNVSLSVMPEIQKRVQERMTALQFTSAQKTFWANHIFFGNVSVEAMQQSYITALLDEWNSTVPKFTAFISNGVNRKPFLTGARLDARQFWLSLGENMIGNATVQLEYLGPACNQSTTPAGTNFT